MKRVKLDYQETTISDNAYEQIAAIVKANRVCELCGNPYTPDNPNVELNRCLKCFLRYHENQGFTYIKMYEVDQYGNETHWFLDPLNVVHYTKTSSKEPQKSEHYTLLYWGFPVPQTWQDDRETKQAVLLIALCFLMGNDERCFTRLAQSLPVARHPSHLRH